MTRARVVVLGSLALATAASAGAVSTRAFAVRSQKEWLEGRAEGVVVESGGVVTLGPRFVERARLEEPVVWAVAAAPDGGSWIGTGSSGKLLRVSARGEVETAAALSEVQVSAVLPDGEGAIVAAGPPAAVYRVRPGREPERLASLEAAYAWAIARGADGAIHVATGSEGGVWTVREGRASLLWDAPDTHVTSLLALDDGSLVAGTAERGLVVRIDAGGAVTVLHDSSYREARALLRSRDGAIWAAINGGASFRDGQAPARERPAEATMTVTAGEGEPAAPQALSLPAPETLGEVAGEIVRMRPGEPAEVVARPRGEMVYALAETRGGRVLAATSKRLLFPAGGGGEDADVVGLPDRDGTPLASALASTASGHLLGTTGPSRLWALEESGALEGSYVSRVLGGETESRWGRLRVEAEIPAGASLALETRSGSTAEADSTWGAWTGARRLEDGTHEVASPASRFLQWRVRLGATPGARPPRLGAVTLYGQPRNRRPVVRAVTVHPAGVLFQRGAPPQGVVEAVPPPLPSMFTELAPARTEPVASGKRLWKRGAQTITWDVADPDEDDVRVDLEVRPRSGGRWLVVRERVEGMGHTFDAEALPDGWWVARVVADDSPSNAPEGALRAERETEPFLVDNTPPVVRVASAAVVDGAARVRVAGEDALAGIWKAEWSIDGGPFVPVAPEDGVADGPREAWEIRTGPLARGAHLVVVRVHDLASQSASVEARVEAP